MPNPALEVEVRASDKGFAALLGKIRGDLGGLAKDAAGVFVGMMGVNAVIGGWNNLSGAISDCVAEARESIAGQKELKAVLASTGEAAGMGAEEATKLSIALQDVTKFSHDEVLKAENMMFTFTAIGREVFPRATEAALNMGQKFGNLDSATLQLGKALQDPIRGFTALRRMGVALTDEQADMIKSFMAVNDIASAQKIILDEVDVEFGGLARAMQTAGDRMRHNADEIKETVGMAIIPIISTATQAVAEALGIVRKGLEDLNKMAEEGGYRKEIEDGELLRNEYMQRVAILRELTEAYGPLRGSIEDLTEEEQEANRQERERAGMYGLLTDKNLELAAATNQLEYDQEQQNAAVEEALALLPAEARQIYADRMAKYHLDVKTKELGNSTKATAWQLAALGVSAYTASSKVKALTEEEIKARERLDEWTHQRQTTMGSLGIADYDDILKGREQAWDDIDKAEKDAAARSKKYWDEAKGAYEDIVGDINGLLKSSDTEDWIRQALVGTSQQFKDSWDEMARRAEDVANLGDKSPWAPMFNIPEDVKAKGRDAIKAYMTLVAEDIRTAPSVEKIGEKGVEALVADYKKQLQEQAQKQGLLAEVFRQAEADPEIVKLQQQLGINATAAIQYGMTMGKGGSPLQPVKDDLGAANKLLTDFSKTWLGLKDLNLTLRVTTDSSLLIPGFADGGYVPGPIGAPRLVMAHGGEQIIPVNQTTQMYSLTINSSAPTESMIGDFQMMQSLAG